MINWAYFPRSSKPTALALSVVEIFKTVDISISSETKTLKSNEVLFCLMPFLTSIGFTVEAGKREIEKVSVPVLYGNNGNVVKAFEVDAHHVEGRFVFEVEAGRAVINNQFLKDLFEACMMDNIDYLCIAVRNVYVGGGKTSLDFEQVVTFFDTLYTSSRMSLPLRGILIVGY